jgi:hypothetical protein
VEYAGLCPEWIADPDQHQAEISQLSIAEAVPLSWYRFGEFPKEQDHLSKIRI